LIISILDWIGLICAILPFYATKRVVSRVELENNVEKCHIYLHFDLMKSCRHHHVKT